MGESTTRWSAASVTRASAHATCACAPGERGCGGARGKTGQRLGVHALCLTCRGIVLLVRAGTRQGFTLLHFDVAWRVGAGTRVGKGGAVEKREARMGGGRGALALGMAASTSPCLLFLPPQRARTCPTSVCERRALGARTATGTWKEVQDCSTMQRAAKRRLKA